ncbi:histidine phosphatase family protein [Deinococcus deserti]|uniref:Putative phosphoglycerate mutase family, putative fructose-2,6-bisphosphatase n=1 Tax=Deinococcus deserti (strain DSM 17065 / CIP 109153 / LMG 22923 / VCD115) TaxID=546414 RepID=C1D327_DEIDV|nr:histidine phosphatase family protein [Deinococcus deserti]ACO47816.2 putative phosphoglycerate mutase family, putative fructose-2,6-bisphosphatase [Deinococcus deserti VCD115]
MPETALTLHLIRHAPTAPNAERRYPEAGEDACLTPEGRMLAAKLRLCPAVIYCSPSRRALETALLAGFDQPLVTPELAEANFGVMAGRTWAELEQAYGATPRYWIEAMTQPTTAFGPPGGDTGQSFHSRVQGWLNSLPPTGEVAAFSHAGVILAALRLTVGLTAAEIRPCGVVTLHASRGTWWLSRLSAPDLIEGG